VLPIKASLAADVHAIMTLAGSKADPAALRSTQMNPLTASFASRGSGVRGSNPLSSTPDDLVFGQVKCSFVRSIIPLRAVTTAALGGIWEIIFSLIFSLAGDAGDRGEAPNARMCGRVASVAGLFARNGASIWSRSGTGERGLMAARARRELSQRACRAAVRSAMAASVSALRR